MKKLLLTLILTATISFVNAQGDVWTSMGSYPTTIGQAFVFVIGTKAYCGTGCAGFGLPWCWVWDSQTNAWTQISDFPDSRYDAAAFAIGSKGYVGTGEGAGGSVVLATFYEYDPATNAWTQKASVPGNTRYGAVGFAIGGKGYMGIGSGGKDLWEYTPSTNTWVQKADFVSARPDAIAFVIGTKAYVGTGGYGAQYKDLYEFNPTANTWTAKANFPNGYITQAAAFAVQNKGYVDGGYIGGATGKLFEYDPSGNTWAEKAYTPGPHVRQAIGFAIGTNGYVATGDNGDGTTGGQFNQFYRYSPSLVGIEEPAMNSSITLSPNPSNGKFILENNNPQFSVDDVIIYNSEGRKIMETNTSIRNQILPFDLSNEANGIYYVQIVSGQNAVTKKILIAR
jgi:N-acetylneuraminic acid mutarotase